MNWISLLDLQSNDMRLVSIVGPTGIGKSALAFEVGNQLRARGAEVSYVDISLIPLNNVPNQLLQNAGITERNISSRERLLQWLRQQEHPQVIILDNCDVTLAADMPGFYHLLDILFTATLKVIVTSRMHLMYHSEHFVEYPVGEINASCQILQATSKRKMNTNTCESITALMGNIPHSLVLIGSILESTLTDISKLICSLEKEMETVCSISVERRLNASISVSLKHLNDRLINLGKYLSLFPATFSLADVCSVLSPFVGEDCVLVDQLKQRSLLMSSNNRYHFRDSIRKHFGRIWKRSRLRESENEFWRQYLTHYSSTLHKWSVQFHENHKNALEIEKQEIRNFVINAIHYCGELPDLYMEILQTFKISIETGFFTSLYTDGDAIDLLRSTLSCIENIVDSNKQGVSDAVHMYVYFTLKLMEHKSEGIELVLEKVYHWLDQRTGSADPSIVANFYLKLSVHYHNLGRVQEELYCHVKRLKALGKLGNCVPSTCSYSEISEAYYSVGSYEWSAYFQRLHIEHSSLSTLQLIEALLRLHTCMVKASNLTEANKTAGKILELSTKLLNSDATEIYGNQGLYSNISKVLHLHNLEEGAQHVDQKLMAAVKEASTSQCHKVEEVRRAIFSLIDSLFAVKQYASVPKVVQFALDTYHQKEDSNEVAALYLVRGKAELYNHKRRQSLDSLKVVLNLYCHNPALFPYARDACKAMLIQTHVEMACFYIVMEETVILARSIYGFIKSDTFDTGQFSSAYIYEFPDSVPNGLLADNIEDAPVLSFYIVFFVKLCIANIRYLFSCRFIFQVLNLVFVVVKFSVVVCVLVCPYLFLYYCINLTKYMYRALWNPVWTDIY